MLNYKNILIPILLILACLGIGFMVGKGCSPKPKTPYFQEPGFKTDTIFAKPIEYYKKQGKEEQALEGKASVVPPKKVIIYRDTGRWFRDTLYQYVTTTGDTDSEWLTDLKAHPQFLGGTFTGTKLKLNLRDFYGNIYEKYYGVDYSTYNYRHDGERLAYYKNKKTPERRFHTASFVYLGYEPFQKAPTIMVDYSLNYNKVGLYVMGITDYSMIREEAGLRITGGLRFKIK